MNGRCPAGDRLWESV